MVPVLDDNNYKECYRMKVRGPSSEIKQRSQVRKRGEGRNLQNKGERSTQNYNCGEDGMAMYCGRHGQQRAHRVCHY